jgi:hypothetical protein
MKAFTQFHLRDQVERQDTCINIYRRSLLYLVSNAFEHKRETPILGMESFFEKLPELTKEHPKRAAVWDWIAAPTTPNDITKRSSSTSHGSFDDDEDTRLAVIERIVRRQEAASAPNARTAKAKSSRKK